MSNNKIIKSYFCIAKVYKGSFSYNYIVYVIHFKKLFFFTECAIMKNV